MLLGPVDLWGGHKSLTVENAWQYSKVYREHWDGGHPNEDWLPWALEGWINPQGVRYPMGKGHIPVCTWWDGQALDYVSARKRIYLPLYCRAAIRTSAWQRLKALYQERGEVTILDFDVQCRNGRSYEDILNDPKHPFGHGYALGWMLEKGV